MMEEHSCLYPCMTDEQRSVYNTIIDAVSSGNEGLLFLYGYGRTGKTILWRTLCSTLHNEIVHEINDYVVS